MTYTRTIYPLTGVNERDVPAQLKALVLWINAELLAIESEVRRPGVIGIQFETQYKIPDRYKDGDLYFFADNVASPGNSAGLYIHEDGGWRKL